jgi:hypothetical protein
MVVELALTVVRQQLSSRGEFAAQIERDRFRAAESMGMRKAEVRNPRRCVPKFNLGTRE